MAAYKYTIDPAHSAAKFWVRHLGISKVHGTIAGVAGEATLDLSSPETATGSATLDVTTINTGNADRDGHLKSPDFFDVATYPQMTFNLTGVSKAGGADYKVTGDLTLHGVTKSITLDAEVSAEMKNPMGPGYKIGLTLTGILPRDDFGLTYNAALEAGGWVIGKEVHLDLSVELDRPE